jgi:serine/threonine protein kinase
MAFCYRDLFIGKYKNLFLHDYTIIRTLGKGTFATVFLAKHNQSGCLKAVKIIDKSVATPNTIKNAQSEFNILKKLDHPCVIKVYGLYEDIGSLYIVSE